MSAWPVRLQRSRCQILRGSPLNLGSGSHAEEGPCSPKSRDIGERSISIGAGEHRSWRMAFEVPNCFPVGQRFKFDLLFQPPRSRVLAFAEPEPQSIHRIVFAWVRVQDAPAEI